MHIVVCIKEPLNKPLLLPTGGGRDEGDLKNQAPVDCMIPLTLTLSLGERGPNQRFLNSYMGSPDEVKRNPGTYDTFSRIGGIRPCIPPFGPAFGCPKSLLAILSLRFIRATSSAASVHRSPTCT